MEVLCEENTICTLKNVFTYLKNSRQYPSEVVHVQIKSCPLDEGFRIPSGMLNMCASPSLNLGNLTRAGKPDLRKIQSSIYFSKIYN